MSYTKHARACHSCHKKRRLDASTLMCAECSGVDNFFSADESPAALRGRWVPNGRGTLVYVEQVA